jgi:GntR family transcriptional regulator, N-acetylglucosamine utilization regulator
MNLPQIDRQSAVPIYHQLKESIYYKIASGEWKRGEQIPSLRELSKELKISLMTARHAIKTLVDEKVLALRKGQGTYILGPKVRENVQTLFSFTAEMLRQGQKPGAKIISNEIINAPPKIAKTLQLDSAASVYHICRLRLANQEPVGLQHSYIPVEFCPGLLKKNLTESLSAILENDYNFHVQDGHQTLRADLAHHPISNHLGLPENAPIMRIERVSYFEDHRPCEHLISIYRGDRYEFAVELHR